MNEKVAVLGCGPAGMMAAHAAVQCGREVVIYSRNVKSPMHGTQFLHHAIPGLTNEDPDAIASVELVGTREGYAHKVYGDPGAPCSWDLYAERSQVELWDLRHAYEMAWKMYSHLIVDVEVTPEYVYDIQTNHRVVLSTIPIYCLADGSLGLTYKAVYIKQDRVDSSENYMVYNGLEHVDYYRESVIFGMRSREYPDTTFPKPAGAKLVRKPLDIRGGDARRVTVAPGVHKLGRYGQWKKGVLTHHAYEETLEILG